MSVSAALCPRRVLSLSDTEFLSPPFSLHPPPPLSFSRCIDFCHGGISFFDLLVLFLVFCSGHLVHSALLPCLLHPLFTFPPFVDCVPRLFRNTSLFSVSSFETQHLLARLYDHISPPFPDCIHILAAFSQGGPLLFVLSDFQ